MGKKTPTATKKSLAVSSIPNHKITNGISASAGIFRIICRVVSSRVDAVFDEPFNKPRKSPKPPPTNRPSKARPALTCTCFQSSPLSSKFQKAVITAVGAGKIRLSKSPVLEAICQSTIKPIGKSQGSNSCPN